jgi:hypothetical protein
VELVSALVTVTVALVRPRGSDTVATPADSG